MSIKIKAKYTDDEIKNIIITFLGGYATHKDITPEDWFTSKILIMEHLQVRDRYKTLQRQLGMIGNKGW